MASFIILITYLVFHFVTGSVCPSSATVSLFLCLSARFVTVAPPPRLVTVAPPPRLAVVSPPPRLTVVTPPSRLAVVTPPSRLAVVTPPSRLAVVTPPSRLAVVTPPSRLAVVPPPSRLAAALSSRLFVPVGSANGSCSLVTSTDMETTGGPSVSSTEGHCVSSVQRFSVGNNKSESWISRLKDPHRFQLHPSTVIPPTLPSISTNETSTTVFPHIRGGAGTISTPSALFPCFLKRAKSKKD
ncbi:hypothetical protein HA466_0176830 [Hirschfeldia incana]|nr:hypothetical protein HA466_0176830 [Hirschfeldia incana]